MEPIKEITIERTYDASAAKIWQAWTDAEELKQWWGPQNVSIPECEVELKVGGKFYIVMEAGEAMGPVKGTKWPMLATFTIVEPNVQLAYTAQAWTEGSKEETLIDQTTEIRFAEEEGKTKITIKAAIYKTGPNAKMAVEGMEYGFNQQAESSKRFSHNNASRTVAVLVLRIKYMATYVALLRGIMPMNPNMRGEKLREVFESLTLKNVATVIASGNVVFETNAKDLDALETKIENALFKQLGFKSATIIRSKEHLEALIKKNPFKGVKDERPNYLVVTFFKDRKKELCTVLDMTNGPTPEFMTKLEKEHGKEITTRTWKTVARIMKKMNDISGPATRATLNA